MGRIVYVDNAGNLVPPSGLGFTFTELDGTDTHSVGVAATFEDWDLAAIIGAGAKYVKIAIYNATGGFLTFGHRKDGSGLVRTDVIQAASNRDGVCECDASRVIECYDSSATFDLIFRITGYWS